MHVGGAAAAEAGPGAPRAAEVSRRLLSLDLLRGCVVLLMLFVNQTDAVEGAPDWLRHAAEDADAVTLPDLVLPAFLFMVGMSIPFALGSRLRRSGILATLRHVGTRGLALLVMGVLVVNADVASPVGLLPPAWWAALTIVGSLLAWQAAPSEAARRTWWPYTRAVGAALLLVLVFLYRGNGMTGLVQIRPLWWGVLGTIGWAYLAAASVYVVVRDRPAVLLACVAALYGLYYVDVLLQPAWMLALRPHLGIGGLIGSQGAVALSGTLLGVLASRHVRTGGRPWLLAARALAWSFTLLAAGVALHLWHGHGAAFDYNKDSATPPWGLVSSAITAGAWLAFFAGADGAGWRRWPPILRVAGENPLLAYLIEPLLIALLAASAVVFGRNPWLYLVERGTAAGLLSAALFACLVGRLAGLLARAGLRLRL